MCATVMCAFPLSSVRAARGGVQQNALYQSLTLNAARHDVQTVVTTIDKSLREERISRKKLKVLHMWLVDHTYGQLDSQKIVAVYFLKLYDVDYVMALHSKARKGGNSIDYRQSTLDAFKALLTYEIIAMSDAERCRDDSVVGVVARNLLPRYRDISYAYTLLNENEISLGWYTAMQTEAQKAERPLNLYLCVQGNKALNNPATYVPHDVVPARWREIRDGLRAKYTNVWKSRYAAALHGDKQ